MDAEEDFFAYYKWEKRKEKKQKKKEEKCLSCLTIPSLCTTHTAITPTPPVPALQQAQACTLTETSHTLSHTYHLRVSPPGWQSRGQLGTIKAFFPHSPSFPRLLALQSRKAAERGRKCPADTQQTPRHRKYGLLVGEEILLKKFPESWLQMRILPLIIHSQVSSEAWDARSTGQISADDP